MNFTYFENLFGSFALPVIICEQAPDYPISFMNIEAKLRLNPQLDCDILANWEHGQLPEAYNLNHCLQLESQDEFATIMQQLHACGRVTNYHTTVKLFDHSFAGVLLNAHSVNVEDTLYFLFCLSLSAGNAYDGNGISGELLVRILQATFHAQNADDAINTSLYLLGSFMGVSRAYIFEDMPDNISRNTYEWCAPGVSSAINDLQNLPQADYSWASFMNTTGIILVSDTKEMDAKDRAILEPQGILSMAILPLMAQNKAFGYIGLDVCNSPHEWTTIETSLLKNVSGILSSLIMRRNAEADAQHVQETLQIVSDSLHSLIYVSDFHTHELLFVNKALACHMNKDPQHLIGKICWQVLQKDQIGPCSFCPNPYLLDKNGLPNEPYVWEMQNTINKNHYLVTDHAIKWTHGQYVHLETATDISDRKELETKLNLYASTDMMTGVYNREWGYKFLTEALVSVHNLKTPYSICFIDIDGLKAANDTFGHEVGDMMILDTVSVILQSVRERDMLCRWGGDEFLLLLNCNAHQAAIVESKIQYNMAQFNQLNQKPFTLSVSIGLQEMTDKPLVSPNYFISEADKKMYANKMNKSGRKSCAPRITQYE